LIFGSFSFIAFLSKFFSRPFSLFDLAFYYLFSFFDLVFYRPLFSRPFFFALVLSLFLAHVVSSLAYPTCLGIKGLVVIVVVNQIQGQYAQRPAASQH
jgi:hypothetical protein